MLRYFSNCGKASTPESPSVEGLRYNAGRDASMRRPLYETLHVMRLTYETLQARCLPEATFRLPAAGGPERRYVHATRMERI
jgi:hypothetical protein